jgi:hypothetical protein
MSHSTREYKNIIQEYDAKIMFTFATIITGREEVVARERDFLYFFICVYII